MLVHARDMPSYRILRMLLPDKGTTKMVPRTTKMLPRTIWDIPLLSGHKYAEAAWDCFHQHPFISLRSCLGAAYACNSVECRSATLGSVSCRQLYRLCRIGMACAGACDCSPPRHLTCAGCGINHMHGPMRAVLAVDSHAWSDVTIIFAVFSRDLVPHDRYSDPRT
jgi:hypothetical protein